MLHGIDVRTYFEDEWSGQLLLNKRVKKHKKEKKQEMQEHELLRHTFPAQSLRRRRATQDKGTTSENKDEQREERPLNMNDFYLGLEVMHTKHGQGRVQVRSCAALYSPTVIHTLTDSPSLSPCHTRLQEFLADGRVQVEFDNGGVHRYNQHSLSKLKVVEAVANHDDEDECHSLTLMDLLLALPWYLIQALLLWLPLSVCPPLARRLKTGEYSWYLLVRSLPPPFTAISQPVQSHLQSRCSPIPTHPQEVPCLKFYASFCIDVVFFVSLTFLSQPSTTLPVHRALIRSIGLHNFVLVHVGWATSILIESLTQERRACKFRHP